MSSLRGYLAAPISVLAASIATAEPPADPAKAYRDTISPIVERHCVGCHRGAKPKGDLDLSRVRDVADDLPRWELIAERLRANEMPPRDAKSQPMPEERKALIAWIERFRADEARRNAGDPGVVLARRLSNAEYDNTIRHLTG